MTVSHNSFSVEVAYATADKQYCITVEVTADMTLLQVVLASGLQQHCPDLEIAHTPMGIFGKRIDHPDQVLIRPGQRVELYRPLLIDPKQARLNRAAQQRR